MSFSCHILIFYVINFLQKDFTVLVARMENIKKKKPYTCSACYSEYLLKSRSMASNERHYVCEICRIVLIEESEMVEHKLMFHKNKNNSTEVGQNVQKATEKHGANNDTHGVTKAEVNMQKATEKLGPNNDTHGVTKAEVEQNVQKATEKHGANNDTHGVTKAEVNMQKATEKLGPIMTHMELQRQELTCRRRLKSLGQIMTRMRLQRQK